MTFKSKKSKSLLMTVVLAGGTVCYIALVFLPGQKAIGKLNAELQDRQKVVLEGDRLAYAIQTTQEDLAAAKRFTEQWQSHAPTEPQLTELYARISAAANASHAKITQFDPRPTETMARLVKVPVSMTVEGNFRQVFNFVRRMEAFPETIWLSDFSMESLAESGRQRQAKQENKYVWGVFQVSEDSKTLTCNLTLTIFGDKRDFSD